jgi:chromosome segregation ATPase
MKISKARGILRRRSELTDAIKHLPTVDDINQKIEQNKKNHQKAMDSILTRRETNTHEGMTLSIERLDLIDELERLQKKIAEYDLKIKECDDRTRQVERDRECIEKESQENHTRLLAFIDAREKNKAELENALDEFDKANDVAGAETAVNSFEAKRFIAKQTAIRNRAKRASLTFTRDEKALSKTRPHDIERFKEMVEEFNRLDAQVIATEEGPERDAIAAKMSRLDRRITRLDKKINGKKKVSR